MVALFVQEMEKMLPDSLNSRFTQPMLDQLDRFGINPRDVPRSVCEMIEWGTITVNTLREEQRKRLCNKYTNVVCDNLLSDLCQMTLMARDPDEEVRPSKCNFMLN